MLKRKSKSIAKKEPLDIIKESLSGEFKIIKIKSLDELSADLFVDFTQSKGRVVCKAKIDEDNLIHLKIENVYGFLFEGFVDDYQWFVDNFYL